MTEPWKQPDQKGALLAAIVLSSLLHLVNISIPTLLLCLGMWGWHTLSLFRPLPQPGPRLLTVAGVFCFFVAASTNEGATVEAFVSLLVLMIALKLFELQRRHDAMMTVIMNYFALVGGMFFSDSLLITLYIVFCLIYNTTALVLVSQPGLDLRRSFHFAGRLTLQALPFMVILFLVFPRFQGGLWGRPKLIQAQSGVSDTLRLGGVASVARNTDVAFRVTFDGPVPPEPRYWRGLVLWHFDGIVWTHGYRRGGGFGPERVLGTALPYRYEVTLEPHQERWLYTLDRPLGLQNLRGIWMASAQVAATWRPVTSRLQYQVASDPAARLNVRQPDLRRARVLGLQVPDSGNPKTRALAEGWQQAGLEPAAIVNAALSFFGRGGFRYTLAPDEALNAGGEENAIDAFLFTVREGFCEHFAASFALLMRTAGVPSRLVVGYLGGEINPYGNYLAVRNSDAHVWCEVLLNNEWQRIDPTAVVAPARLQTGTTSRAAATENLTLDELFSMGNLPAWLKPLGDGWDFLNMRWNQWVMQYSAAEQRQLFASLGLDWGKQASRIGLFIGGIAILGICYFVLLTFVRGGSAQRDAVAASWLKFLGKLESARIPQVRRGLGPMQILAAVRQARPDLAVSAEQVVRTYVRLRYARIPAGQEAVLEQELVQAVRGFATFTPPGKRMQPSRKGGTA